MENISKFCTQCGEQIDPSSGAQFCSNCGQSLSGAVETPPTKPSTSSPEIDKREVHKDILARAVQAEVVRGGRVESQSGTMATIVHGRRVNHVLHFFISFLTIGIWVIVWLIIALTGGESRILITVDSTGNVLRQRT